MTTSITTEAVTEAIHAAVTTKGGDYIYKSGRFPTSRGCAYTDPDGAPSCIVGHVVAALDPEEFEDILEYENSYDASYSAYMLLNGTPDDSETGPVWRTDLDGVTKSALEVAQSIQDGKHAWKYAVEAYDRVLAGESRGNVYDDIYRRSNAEKRGAL